MIYSHTLKSVKNKSELIFLLILYYFREDMRNSFNFLLIALICMDSGFLLASAIEVFRKLDSASWYTDSAVYNIHLRLFPYFLYPLLSIMVTGSIFMTVAIAFERFFAVHYPIDYSQVCL